MLYAVLCSHATKSTIIVYQQAEEMKRMKQYLKY